MNWLGTINHFPNLRCLGHAQDIFDLEDDVLAKTNLSKDRSKPLSRKESNKFICNQVTIWTCSIINYSFLANLHLEASESK